MSRILDSKACSLFLQTTISQTQYCYHCHAHYIHRQQHRFRQCPCWWHCELRFSLCDDDERTMHCPFCHHCRYQFGSSAWESHQGPRPRYGMEKERRPEQIQVRTLPRLGTNWKRPQEHWEGRHQKIWLVWVHLGGDNWDKYTLQRELIRIDASPSSLTPQVYHVRTVSKSSGRANPLWERHF